MASPGDNAIEGEGVHAKRNKRKKELAKQRKALSRSLSDEQELSDEMSPVDLEGVLGKVLFVASPLYEIKLTAEKGLGVFAIKDITKGTEILREAPLFRGGCSWLSKEAAFAVLSDDKKKRYLALDSRCNCAELPCKTTEVMKIWYNNSFETPTSLPTGGNYVYEIASRLNHACDPNTSRKFTEDINIVFYAGESIRNGEEITTAYDGGCGTTSFRRKFLYEKYGFLCRCRVCIINKSLPFDAAVRNLVESDIVDDRNGAGVLGKPTTREIAAEKVVEAWLKELTAWSQILQLRLINGIRENKNIDVGPKSACVAVLLASMKSWATCLRDQNRLGLSEDVIEKYMDRLSKALVASGEMQCDPEFAAKIFFDQIRRTIIY
ncbi:hypothetical protein EG329_007355 [Mollisiaceae sp. DMI_Dod_QoI]|nr:hypothetical protein EG329_007355 [Helotiales sp. DMI_Dod_QoI]